MSLHFHTLSDAKSALAYFRGMDYHFEGAELKAYTMGKGAERLGLSRVADPEQFRSLVFNEHPFTHAKMTKAKREDRDFARDMTVGIPKSVTIAATVGGDGRIEPAVQRALERMFAVMERDTETRVRKGGKDENRHTGNLAAFVFPHQTSRPIRGEPDPQLHWHVVILNQTFDREEGEWKAVQFRPLLRDSGYYNAIFRSELARELNELGYEVEKTKDAFEITGVPSSAIKQFSRRTTQIEKLAETLGVRSPEGKARLGATSRENKSKGRTWDDLIEGWRNRLSLGELAAVDATRAGADMPLLARDRDREALDWAVRHCFERDSVVKQRELVTHALRHGLGEVTPEGIYAELGSRKDLIRRKVNGVDLVSTQSVLSEEKRITQFAVKGRGRYRRLAKQSVKSAMSLTHNGLHERGDGESKQSRVSDLATPSAFEQAVIAGSSYNPLNSLSPSQATAVRHVWTSPDRLILIRGAAGTGKTTLTKATLAGVNVPWVILAPSAEASRGVLRRDGFEAADTLSRFLVDEKLQEQARGGLIWLDEASLAGAHDIARLTQLADSLGARVVLSGDRRQHKSVARGDILALLEDKAGLPVAEVSEIRRQSGEYKQAVELLAKGDVSKGFAKLDALGWVKECDVGKNGQNFTTSDRTLVSDHHVRGMHEQIATDYLAAVREGKSVLTIAPTHAEGEKVTVAIREKLKQDGRLKGEERTFERLVPLHLTEAEKAERSGVAEGAVAQFVRASGKHKAGERYAVAELAHSGGLERAWAAYLPSTIRLAAGDAIRITANGKTIDGHRLNNGATYSVAGFTDKGDIRLNNGWLLSKDWAHLAHGYVSTSHASQGKTVDVALVAMGNESLGAMGAEQFYVSASRARQQTKVYVEDKSLVLDAIQRDDSRLLASDLVRQSRTGLRQRIKKHLSFLKRVATLGRDREHTPQLQQEILHERL